MENANNNEESVHSLGLVGVQSRLLYTGVRCQRVIAVKASQVALVLNGRSDLMGR